MNKILTSFKNFYLAMKGYFSYVASRESSCYTPVMFIAIGLLWRRPPAELMAFEFFVNFALGMLFILAWHALAYQYRSPAARKGTA